VVAILKEPSSMDECLYFTNRTFDDGKGRAMAWVYRPECPACKKGRLGKPVKKNGKVDKKANYYECPECKHQVSMEEADNMLKVEVKYTCPKCGKSGETTTEYKRKNFLGVPAFVFACVDCGEKIGLTKKMKEAKK
jgi:predicted SprT family Zn-dependent metalloprotease